MLISLVVSQARSGIHGVSHRIHHDLGKIFTGLIPDITIDIG